MTFTLMRTSVTLGICLLAFGCNDSTKNYELDAGSFTPKYLNMVEQCTGITLPNGSHGLNLLYKGHQIDAAMLAKVEIPAGTEAALATQLSQLPSTDEHVISSLTSQASWWIPSTQVVRTNRMLLHGHNLVHVILTDQNGQSILYVEWYQ
jgi:hypothetical protein